MRFTSARLRKVSPLHSPSLQNAIDHFRSSRLAEADAVCREILAAQPDLPLALLLAGEIAVAQGKNAAATDHFRALALNLTTPVEIQIRASLFLARSGDLASGAAGLRYATQGNAFYAVRGNAFSVLLDLGELQEKLGQRDEALATYAAAIRVNPGDARPFTREAILKLRHAFGPSLASPLEKQQDSRLTRSVAMASLGCNGRFGNQLLQYAFLRCYGRVHGLRVEVPEWIGRWLFDLDDPYPEGKLPQVREDGDRLVNSLSRLSPEVFAECDLWGYFCGHTKHFQPHRDFIRTLFQPGKRVRETLESVTADIRRRGRTLVAIHLRRGDFGYGRFWIAPERWYLEWLEAFWHALDKPILYIASDDTDVIRHFAAFDPISMSDVATNIPGGEFLTDFHMLTQADCLAISNSTFSFVAAMLNDKAKIFVRPNPEQKCLTPFDPWNSEVLLEADSANR